MDDDDAICLVQDLWELQSEGKSPGEGISPTQDTAVQQRRKTSRDPTTRGDEEDRA